MVKTGQRIIGALSLDEDTLYSIGIDRRETWPAVVLFGLASVLAGSSWILKSQTWPFALLTWFVTSILALGLIGEVARFSALFLFGGGVQRNEVVRLAGYAMIPLAFAAIPYLGIPAAVYGFVILFRGMKTYFALGTGRTLLLIFFSTGAAFVFWSLMNAVVISILSPV